MAITSSAWMHSSGSSGASVAVAVEVDGFNTVLAARMSAADPAAARRTAVLLDGAIVVQWAINSIFFHRQ